MQSVIGIIWTHKAMGLYSEKTVWLRLLNDFKKNVNKHFLFQVFANSFFSKWKQHFSLKLIKCCKCLKV